VTKIDPLDSGREVIRYIDIGSIDGDRQVLTDVGLLRAADAPTRARQVVATGDTIFSTVRPYLRKIAYIDDSLDGEFASTGFTVLRPGPKVHPRFLYYYAISERLLDQVLPLQRGVSYPAVRDKDVLSACIPVPSLEKQRQIVEILEEHLSRLDAGSAALEQAGRRTTALRSAALARLPRGKAAPLAAIADIQGGIQKQPRRAPVRNAYPFLRVGNVTPNGLDLTDVHRIELFDGELGKFRLEQGDLLVVEGNGSPAQIGRAALWDGSINDCVHQNHLIRVRPRPGLLPEYLEAIWNSPAHRRQLTAVASSTSGLYTLSVAKLASLMVPVPPLVDQRHAAARVAEVKLSCDHTAHQVDVARQRAARLRRALLTAAFTGRLTGRASDDDLVEELAGA
jgi:type I restriction enzyme S subunit